MSEQRRLPMWLFLTWGIAVGLHVLANAATRLTIALMGAPSEFAIQARNYNNTLLVYFLPTAFLVATVIMIGYLWPIVRYFRHGCPQPASTLVQQRVIGTPLIVAAVGFAAWLSGLIFFPAVTLYRFGHWSTDLMSQQVLSPLVNGFLASTTSYLLVDWLFRRAVIPRVFPHGGLVNVGGAAALHVRGRLFVFLVAVAFLPLFTVLGLVRAAAVRLDAGSAIEDVMPQLTRATEITFAIYTLLGVVLALVLARTFTHPLQTMAAALRRLRAGDLDLNLAVTSSDEVGVLEDGVNAMATTLREKERILQTFGRVVEPSVRDRLLSGTLQPGGELRTASILFCDLRGFSAFAEHAAPHEVVATLNDLFTAMTSWVRDCGGFVDKFVGDGMLVVFGLFDGDTPADQRDGVAAAAAVRCAIGMQERVGALNVARHAVGRAPLAVKIGVHSGEVVAGTIGAADRHEYTVVGDTVNVAARLQALCSEQGCDVLVSEVTYRLATAHGIAAPVMTTSAVHLRGREGPVQVFGIGDPAKS